MRFVQILASSAEVCRRVVVGYRKQQHCLKILGVLYRLAAVAVVGHDEHEASVPRHVVDGWPHLFQLLPRVKIVIALLSACAEPVGVAAVQAEVPYIACHRREQGEEVPQLRFVYSNVPKLLPLQETQCIAFVPRLVPELDGQRKVGQHVFGEQQEVAVAWRVFEPGRVLQDHGPQPSRVPEDAGSGPKLLKHRPQLSSVLESRSNIGIRGASGQGLLHCAPYLMGHAAVRLDGEQETGRRLLQEGFEQRDGGHAVERTVDLDRVEAQAAGVVDKVHRRLDTRRVHDTPPVGKRVATSTDTQVGGHRHESPLSGSATRGGGSSPSVPSAKE